MTVLGPLGVADKHLVFVDEWQAKWFLINSGILQTKFSLKQIEVSSEVD